MRSREEKKNKKGQESTIGKIIYGFLLFMPLIAIASTILVNTFNKEITQPTQEVEVNYKYETNEVNSVDDFEVGNIYTLNSFDLAEQYYLYELMFSADYLSFLPLNDLTYSADNIDNYDSGSDDSYIRSLTSVTISSTNTEGILNITLLNGSSFYSFDAENFEITNISFDFILDSFDFDSNAICEYISPCENIPIESVEITEQDTSVNNIFYYAVDKVTESPLFSWATNSIIYTTTNATCNALSITTPFVPLLLAYWLIISVIYFLYDIALMLVWMIHKKIHELQESF